MDTREPARDALTILGPGASFKGDLIVDGCTKILGKFEGTIRGAEVQIGAGATCHATIEADTIIIDGTHQGDLIARECLELAAKAHVQGDVTAAALAVAQGATFIGRCIVGPDALSMKPLPEVRVPARKPRTPDWTEPTPAPTGDWLSGSVSPVAVRPWSTATSLPAEA